MLLNQKFKLDFRQSEVDFVIPNLKKDLKLYVDPYLFYQSNLERHQAVHGMLHEFFSIAIEKVRDGQEHVAERMLVFPEVKEIMFGHSKGGHSGRGLGDKRGHLVYQELVANEDVQEKGITHLAEMQLLIEGVGYDLISDMCVNITKKFFVSYTQEQAAIHDIPIEKDVCLEHVFDWKELEWDDIHADLPINPFTGSPILLVPKRVVRRIPIFDHRDFWQSTYRYMLRSIEEQRSLRALGKKPKILWKDIDKKYEFSKRTVVQALHENPELRHSYVETLEKKKPAYIPAADLSKVAGADRGERRAKEFAEELTSVKPGNNDAKQYEKIVLRVLTKLFSPPLSDPKEQVGSYDQREYVDITFYNSGHVGLWADVKNLWRSQIVVFEIKNMDDLSNEEFFQLSARLNDVRGFFGVLVSRKKKNLDVQRAYRRLNTERKVLLCLTDEDLLAMLEGLDNGRDATEALARIYRQFIDAQ